MNCFEWQNRVSDYLDGVLIGASRKEADEHLENCKECSDRYNHYRSIVNSISAMPRTFLPVAIRKAPHSFSIVRSDASLSRSKWERIPWFIRSSVEGLGIAFIILFIIAMVPKIRTIYEKSMERRLDIFTAEETLDAQTESYDVAKLVRGKNVLDANEQANDFDGEFADDNDEDEVESHETERAGTQIRVGNAEIWRFVLKTDSPHELPLKIVAILTDLRIPKDTPGFGGVEAPGGIQFDMIVQKSTVPGIKQNLQRLSKQSGAQKVSPINEPFTWYKNKSKRPIPSGKSRVVIWLSQM